MLDDPRSSTPHPQTTNNLDPLNRVEHNQRARHGSPARHLPANLLSPAMTVLTFRNLRLSLVTSALLLFPATPETQETHLGPLVAPSGRATTTVVFNGRLMDGGTDWFNGSRVSNWSSVMTIDYGQPHARGRAIFGSLVPYNEVWRLGANWATSFSLDVDVRIGDLNVPRGLYSLFLLPHENTAELIINKQTKQWGTDYDPALDLGRTALKVRSLSETTQSLTVTLEPIFPQEAGQLPTGELRIVWEDIEFSTNWSVLWP